MSDEPAGSTRLSETDLADVQAYWTVYERVLDAAREQALDELRLDPELAPVIEHAEQDTQQEERSRRMLAEAVRANRWEPYLELLREYGLAYARLGLTFDQWFRIVNVVRRYTVPELVAAYVDDHDRLASAIRGKGLFYDLALRTIGEAYLQEREQTIAKQQAAIAELSTPVLRLRPGLLLMPVIGVVDSTRSRHLTEALLHSIRDNRARVVVMDITGVAEVDSEVANRLIQTAEAARLMGALPILTGISTGVAQTLVTLGVDLKGLQTVGDLQTGIEQADALLEGRQPLEAHITGEG